MWDEWTFQLKKQAYAKDEKLHGPWLTKDETSILLSVLDEHIETPHVAETDAHVTFKRSVVNLRQKLAELWND
jgi:hypothetical protein